MSGMSPRLSDCLYTQKEYYSTDVRGRHSPARDSEADVVTRKSHVASALHARWYCNSHQIQCATQLLPEVRNPGCPPPLAIDAFLAEDRRLVIVGVESLREAERIFGQDGKFERADHLFHHFVQPGRLQHQVPEN